MRSRSVCVVGAGAAGLVLAASLLRRGWRVTVVEGGGPRPAPTLEDTYRAVVEGIPHRGIHEGRVRAWGGSTTRWGGQLWPWEPHEFEARPRLGIAGWPIGYDDIAPYYSRALGTLGVANAGLDAEGARRRGAPLPAFDPSRLRIKYSMWLPWKLRNLGRSIGRGVRRHAEAVVMERTTVTGLAATADGTRITGVRVRDAAGERLLPVDRVVIAGGAVETTRLLLASRDEGVIHDDSGWLGRGFMDHLSVRTGRFAPRDSSVFARAFSPIVVDGVQYTPRLLLHPGLTLDEGLLGAYGHWEAVLPGDSALHVLRERLRAIQAGSTPRIGLGDLGRIARGALEVAALLRGVVLERRRYFPRDATFHLRIDSEQLPDRESCLTLSPERDAYGLPRVRVRWRVSELERRTVRRTREFLAEELEARGVGTLEQTADAFDDDAPWSEAKGDSFHMMGGTRMAKDARDGVVDPEGRVFAVENLFVAGASVFPTGGMANPTLTLVALALRLGDHLDGGT